MKKLTKRQQEIFDFIKGFIQKHGWAPTHREIAKHFGFTVVAAYNTVHAIRRKGFIDFAENMPRSIKIKEPLTFYCASVASPDGRVTGISREVK